MKEKPNRKPKPETSEAEPSSDGDNAFLPALTFPKESTLYPSPVSLFEPLQGQDEQLGVMLVGEWGEWDG